MPHYLTYWATRRVHGLQDPYLGVYGGCATAGHFGEVLTKLSVCFRRVEITSGGRRELKFNPAVVSNPQTQELRLVWGYAFVGVSTGRLRRFLNFLGQFKRNTSSTYASLKNWTHLTIGHGILQARRYTVVCANAGSNACTLFHLGKDLRYIYV